MRDSVLKSREYDRELESLRVFAGSDNYIKDQILILENTSRLGIPTVQLLQKEFSNISEKMLKQEMLEKKNKSFLDKVVLKFSSVVHVRKITGDEDSQKKEDIIARSQLAIESGNVELAINELEKLSEVDRNIFTIWTKKAENYINSINAAEQVLKYVTRPIVSSSIEQ